MNFNHSNHIYDGILFIGDPHVGSKKPGRRTDKSFTLASIDKVEQSLAIAREKNQLPVFLGDLLNRKDEDSMTLMALLIASLMKSRDAICPLGNHDKSEVEELTDYEPEDISGDKDTIELDPIQVIIKAEPMKLINEPTAMVFNVKDGEGEVKKVGIYFVPYGYDIPKTVKPEFKETKPDHVIMVTHHDLSFDPVFAHIEMKEIKGCGMVVNGHLHKNFPHQDFGDTRWFNPGNIMRMSLTERSHVPSVWSWRAGDSLLTQNKLRYNENIFDMTGFRIKADAEIKRENDEEYEVEEAHSEFVRLLNAESSLEMSASGDGSILEEDISHVLDEHAATSIARENVSDVRYVIAELHKKAVSDSDDDTSIIEGLHIPEEEIEEPIPEYEIDDGSQDVSVTADAQEHGALVLSSKPATP